MKLLLPILLTASLAHAGTKVTATANGVAFVDDGSWTQLQQIKAMIAAMPVPVCAQPNFQPILDAIKAIPACTGTPPVVTPPVVTPPVVTPPAAGSSGIFIGTTQYNSLGEVAGAYKPGDTIRITKSLDNQSGAFVTGDVTIVCDPGVKLTWSAGTNLRPAWSKGIFVFEGSTTTATVKGCEMSGLLLAGNLGGNGSAIRVSPPTANLIVDGIYAHDNNNGILGGGAHTVIKNSRFEHNGIGSGGTANVHNIYIDTIDLLEVDHSYFGPVSPANFLKSRAKATVITNSVFESKADTGGSYLIDLPNGGAAVVKNNVLVKAPNQPQRFILSYGVEGFPADGRTNTYEFANNIVVADMPTAAFINLAAGGVLNFHDDVLVGSFDQMNAPIANAKFFADRASAGMPAAPALPVLPAAVMSVMKAQSIDALQMNRRSKRHVNKH